MLRIALTGGIACGKSTAAEIISELGLDVIEADEIARDLMQPGTKVYLDIKREFGPSVFEADGNIDRKALGRLVMRDAKKRNSLNSIVHPHVIDEWQKWLEERPPTTKAAVVVVPLLYEAGQSAGWDAVVCVSASRANQVERLAGRGLGAEEAAKWLAAQMKLSEKMRQADFVVCNNGSLTVLRKQIERIIKEIMEKV